MSVNVPVAATEEAESVSVEEALPPAGGVTLAEEKVALTPLGKPETVRPTVELKLFTLFTVTTVLPLLPPWTRLIEPDERLRVKSGDACTGMFNVSCVN